MDPPSGLEKMITVSLLVHAAAFAIVVFAPNGLLGRHAVEPRTVMTISLGGSEGPMNGGLTAAAAKSVQAAVPKEELKKQDAYAPPAATKPEMVIATKTRPPTKTSQTPVKESPDQAR